MSSSCPSQLSSPPVQPGVTVDHVRDPESPGQEVVGAVDPGEAVAVPGRGQDGTGRPRPVRLVEDLCAGEVAGGAAT